MAIVISGVNNNDKITASDGTIDLLSGVNYGSEVTVPSFKVGSDIQFGNAGIITATTLVGNVTGNVNATSNLLLQIGGSEKFRVGSSGQLGIAGANYGTSGQVLTSGGSGSAATWSTISGTTINNNADNRVITGSGSANTLNGEQYFTWNGNNLALRGGESQNCTIELASDEGDDNADFWRMMAQASDNALAIDHYGSGSWVEQLRLSSSGQMGLGMTPTRMFEVKDSTGANRIANIRGTGASGAYLAFLDQNTTDDSKCRVGSSGGNNLVMRGDTVQFATGAGSEHGRFDGSGRLLLGHTSNINVAGHDSSLLVTGSDYNKHTINIIANENTNRGAMLQFAKNRSGSVGGATVVQDDDYIGQIRFVAADSADLNSRVAEIYAAVDGTPGANDTPGRLGFMTTPDGSDGSVERVRITSGGTTRIGDSTAYSSLGDSDYQCVIHPNRSNSSKAALGLHIKQTGGQGGGTAANSICLRIDNTANYNNASHMYGIFTDVNQQYVQPTTGCHVETQGVYSETIVFDGKLEKGVNAATNGITYKSNIVQTGTELGSTYHMRCYNNNSERLRITLGGNIQNTNNSYGQISDVKFKENIVDANSQWDDIKAIKVRNFNFKASTGFETHKQIGVIAQELETVSAGLIDITNDTELNESTGEGTVTGTTKYVKYSILYMKSVKALQEAMTRIETLEAKVATLEGS